jgi:hypothetical protein
MKVKELLEKIEKLEARVRELEAKAPQILSYPMYVPAVGFSNYDYQQPENKNYSGVSYNGSPINGKG